MFPYLRFELVVEPAGGRAAPAPGTDPLPTPLLRRILGKALVDRHCPFGAPRCQEVPAGVSPRPGPRELCRLAEACPYGVLVAASRTPRPPFALHRPPATGSGTTVELTLYAAAWRFYPWALGGLAAALAAGAGRERIPWRVAEAVRVRSDRRREAIAGADLAGLPPDLEPDLLAPAVDPFLALRPVTVEFVSPTRLIRDGRFVPGDEPVPFAVLVARLLDRFAGLYGEAASEVLRPEIRAVVEPEAARVPILADATRWVESHDYSARKGAEMLLGGKVGRVRYGGEAARFLPLLLAGEVLHVGKNTASGCGRFEVTVDPL